MKYFIFCLAFSFCFASLYAQKQTLPKSGNVTAVNQKLERLKTTINELQTTLNKAKSLMTDLQKQKDALNELNSIDMLQLQQLMDKKSQLEQMISNTMKAGSETKNNIARNLKSS